MVAAEGDVANVGDRGDEGPPLLWADRNDAVDDRLFKPVEDLRFSSLSEFELVVRRGVGCGWQAARAGVSEGDKSDDEETPEGEKGTGVTTMD